MGGYRLELPSGDHGSRSVCDRERRAICFFVLMSHQEVSIKTNASSSPASPDMDTPSTFFLNLSLNKLVLYLLLGASNKHKNKKNN